MTRPGDWLRSLPTELSAQRAILDAFVATASEDDRIRALVVGCSIGRGAADRLSDIDALFGVRPDAWESALASSREWVERAGRVADMNQLILPEGAAPGKDYQHTYALYANGVELDLVVSRVREDWRRRADWVVLYDADGSIPEDVRAWTQTADDLKRWAYAALTRLNALAKYLERGALWEAHLCLENARADLWRICALAAGVPDAQFGVTAVFDDPRRPIPAGIERTVAGLDRTALLVAAIACCDLLIDTWRPAADALGERLALPPLATHVRERLRGLMT